MTERRLPISLEGLWNNPNEIFTVRYKDINPKYQTILAKRIKQTAKQKSLRKENGPTKELIQEALHEINPVIFSEMQRSVSWYRNHQVFGIGPAVYIAGYKYNMLCQAVYLMTCRKKALNVEQINRIGRLTYEDWETVTQYVNQRLGLVEDEDERITPIENLGIEDITRARERAETSRENRIPEGTVTPDENYDLPIEDNDANLIGEYSNQQIGGYRISFEDGRMINRQRFSPPIRIPPILDIEATPHPPLREWQQRYMPEPLDRSANTALNENSFIDELSDTNYSDDQEDEEEDEEETEDIFSNYINERERTLPSNTQNSPYPEYTPGARSYLGIDPNA